MSAQRERYKMDKKYQVFVSSTYEDLQDERKAVMEALLQMNCFPVGMEYFNASDESQWEVIKQLIDECDYYVLIVAGRYGSVEESTGKSYTQKEFEYAVSKGVPVISFLHKEPDSLPKSKTEQNKDSEVKLNAFKEDVQKRLCKFWTSADNLASQVVLSLTSLIKSKPRVGWVKADQLNAESSKEILKLREQIDFLNAKIHEIEDKDPEGIEDLQQGEDEVTLLYVSGIYGNQFFKFTWNRIIAALAPHMINECAENSLKLALHDLVKQAKKDSPSIHTLSDECFQTIKVQLIALGIIKPSTKKHSTTDANTYWTLTPYGNKVMMRLKALKKEKKETK